MTAEIRHEDVRVGSLWLDPDGTVWEVYHQGARAHSMAFVRPGRSEDAMYPPMPGWLPMMRGRRGADWQLATVVRMNLDGWRRA